jgi:plasmid stabilization system protein ParE
MKFVVSTLRRAEGDIIRIHAWISERSEDGANRWYEAARQAIASLGQEGDQHGLAPDCEETEIEVRQKLFKTRRGRLYRLLYTIVGNEVRVLRVRGPGQDVITVDDISE